MSYQVGFEGLALVQLKGLPPDAFDALRAAAAVSSPGQNDIVGPSR